MNIAELSLVEVADSIRTREISSVEATKACLDRIEQWQPVCNCFISIDADGALRAAADRDRAVARGDRIGALHGVPMAHKDLFLRKGRVATCGSMITDGVRASATATVLERLDNAGAVTVGTLNMSEFAIGPTGHNEHYGDCRNPWNSGHISGGSSSGSAAAVAARLVFGSLGSDTGGSIRGPAAHCGVVGIKPTYGRVSRAGAIPRSWSMDCIGPLARTVADCARILSVIAGADANDSTTSARAVPDYGKTSFDNLFGVRIGVPEIQPDDQITNEVHAAIAEAICQLRKLGAEIVAVKLPDLSELYALGDMILKCEGSAIHSTWLAERSHDYSIHARARLDAGFYVPAVRYIQALNLRKPMLKAFLADVMSQCDVLLTPCIGFASPKLSDLHDRHSADVSATVSRLTTFTRPYSYLGLPSMSLPCGMNAEGLPLSLQLAARPFGEEQLFLVGQCYQKVTAWHQRSPVAASNLRPAHP